MSGGKPRIAEKDMAGYRGYIFSRPFLGNRVPQHVQNLVIRDYCQRNGLNYLLSATEYAMPGSFLMLRGLLEDLQELDGIVAYSLFQMPERSMDRLEIVNHVLGASKSLHFAVENLALRDTRDLERLETLWNLQQVLPRCPQQL